MQADSTILKVKYCIACVIQLSQCFLLVFYGIMIKTYNTLFNNICTVGWNEVKHGICSVNLVLFS